MIVLLTFSGFGVCCSFDAECDTTTSQNGTYFTSPDTLPSVCSLMITPLNDDICQVSLELLQHQGSLSVSRSGWSSSLWS